MTSENETTPAEQTAAEDETPSVSKEAMEAVQVDTEPLERAEDAIDEAREAVSKVAQTDSIDEEATGAGDLPAFADSSVGGSGDAAADSNDSDDSDDGEG